MAREKGKIQMGSTIAASLFAFSRELRTLDRLLRQVGREAPCMGFGGTSLPRVLEKNLVRLAGRADELALHALLFSAGHPDRLLGPIAQPRSFSNHK